MNYSLKDFRKEINSIESDKNHYFYNTLTYDKKNRKILNEIDLNHNYPWIKEIWERNKERLDSVAIKYRGNTFTYEDFFLNSYKYAKSLKSYGIKKGDEFICCLENTPEFPFIMGATSIVGAKVNLLSSDMDKEYLKQIINNATSNLIFVSEKNIEEFSYTLCEIKNKIIVLIPLEFSIGKNQFKNITDQYYKVDENKINSAIQRIEKVIGIDGFLKNGEKYKDTVFEKTGLDDDFTITYTSGSTSSNKPKGLVHKVRSYITMGRYHDSEISKIPSMKNLTMLALVRTMSDTDFMSAISDVFMQSANVALEPINDKDFVLESILMNKPAIVLTSRSVWLYVMKKQMKEEKYKKIKFPYLIAPMCIGEPLDGTEERILNKWFRKLKSGVSLTHTPMSVVCMSIAGGDSEHGGIFVKMYRSLQSKRFSRLGYNGPVGMSTYGMVKIQCLRKDGTYADYLEPGNLVANSPCTMHGYVNNEEANKSFYIKDAYGKEWANLNTYGFIDKFGNISVKGRINNDDNEIPNYLIADEILKDTKRIMSCEVVNVPYENNKVYVAHIEFQMYNNFNEKEILNNICKRCVKKFGVDILNNLYFRIRDNEESFPITPTLKRSFKSLIDEGITDKCVNAIKIYK